MKKSLIAILIGIASYSPIFANENMSLDDVVVTASRTIQSREAVVADVTVIDREQIERAGADSFTDLLRKVPGVQISTNGGAGTASSIYLRGTNDQHLVVLVDGLRINSLTLGTTAFENLPLAQIERIEVLRGPASSRYGADAIGGVIQIFTRKSQGNQTLAHAAIGYGTYSTKTAEAGVSGSAGQLRYGINVNSLDTESFSTKRIRTGKDSDNDSYRNLGVSAFTELELAKGHSWNLQFFQSNGHNEFDSNYENFSEQLQRSYAFTSRNQFTDIWHSTFKLGMGIDDSESHARPNINPASSSYNPKGVSTYRSEQQQLSWQNDLRLPIGTLTLAYERLEQDVDGQANVKTRFSKERNNDSFMAGYLGVFGNHTLQTSLREDHNTQFGNFTTGGVGYAYQFNPNWKASTSYGKAFKAPTFNQLYYPNFGDPTLQPEKSDNIEASLKYQAPQYSVGVTLFENHIRNLIANAGPATAGCTLAGFCPSNAGKVEIQGATFEGAWHIADSLLLSGHFTVQSPRDEKTDNLLTRRGNRYGTITLQQDLGDFNWGAEVTGASVRYNDVNNQFRLAGYTLLNVTASYAINPEWKLNMRANNLLDKDYVLASSKSSSSPTAPDYNVAGSNIFISLRYEMNP